MPERSSTTAARTAENVRDKRAFVVIACFIVTSSLSRSGSQDESNDASRPDGARSVTAFARRTRTR
jgi:hypothetical protein